MRTAVIQGNDRRLSEQVQESAVLLEIHAERVPFAAVRTASRPLRGPEIAAGTEIRNDDLLLESKSLFEFRCCQPERPSSQIDVPKQFMNVREFLVSPVDR